MDKGRGRGKRRMADRVASWDDARARYSALPLSVIHQSETPKDNNNSEAEKKPTLLLLLLLLFQQSLINERDTGIMSASTAVRLKESVCVCVCAVYVCV